MTAFTELTEMTDPLMGQFEADRQRGTAQVAPALAHAGAAPRDEMAGSFQEATDLRRFLLAGRATLTVEARASRSRFTFKFSRPEVLPNEIRERPIWVSVLSGPDNTSDYAYLGTIWIDAQGIWAYRHGKKSSVGEDAPSVRAARWFLALLQRDPAKLFEQAEVYHAGRCGRCGRKLTVPESITTGFGPECAGRMGL